MSLDAWCLKHDPAKGSPVKVSDPRLDHSHGEGGIRCPHCGWTPRRQDAWSCVCGTVWNTFETRGVCPGCSFKWLETQCLRCALWSLHDDWYVHEDDPVSLF